MKKSQREEVSREEAAPAFPAIKQRLEEKEQAFRHEMEQFLGVLKLLGTPIIEELAVHFVYYNPAAQSVAVSGEFNQWTSTPMTALGQTGIFYHTAEFRGPARVEYKLIVDGQWIVDPCCPNRVDNGIGEQNSFLWGNEKAGEAERIPAVKKARAPRKKQPSTPQQPGQLSDATDWTPPIGGISEQDNRVTPSVSQHLDARKAQRGNSYGKVTNN